MKKATVPKPKTSWERAVARYAERVLTTTVLSVDPSSSSRGSQPGYALFRGGVLQEAGVLDIPPGLPLNQKLGRLVQDLQSGFTGVDILILEYISPFFAKQRSHMSLQRACGAIMGAVPADICLECPPQTWHLLAPENYVKTDMNDAILMGTATFVTASKLLGLPWEQYRVEAHDYISKYRSDRG